MATSEELITKLNNDLNSAYSAIEAKGGTVPEYKTADNLTDAINSITGGGGGGDDDYTSSADSLSYDVDDLESGEYGAIAYLDSNKQLQYYVATAPDDLKLTDYHSSSYSWQVNKSGSAIYSSSVIAVAVGPQTTIDKSYYFMPFCAILETVKLPEEWPHESLGNYFCRDCPKLHNNIVLPKNIKSVGDYFMYNCTEFNADIVMQDGLESIGSYFMGGCKIFNRKIDFPSSLMSIDSRFLTGCTAFNQELTFSQSTNINYEGFLYGCSSFNKPLHLFNGSEIGQYFLQGCSSFNSAITLPSSLTTVGNWFMRDCTSFNKELYIPDSVTSIGLVFMSNVSSFNKPLHLPDSLQTIGHTFMEKAYKFDQDIVFPAGITLIDGTVLEQCDNMTGIITVNTTVVPKGSTSGDYSLCSMSNDMAPCYTKGIGLKGPGAEAWIKKYPPSTSTYANARRKTYLVEE